MGEQDLYFQNILNKQFSITTKDGNEQVEQKKYWEDWTVLEHIDYKITFEKMASKEAIKEVAKERELPKREVYASYHKN